MKTFPTPINPVDAAHDVLSDLLENPDAGNDEIRDAAIRLCTALNAAERPAVPLREEPNQLANSHAELLECCRKLLASSESKKSGDIDDILNELEIEDAAREAIRKAGV